MEHRRIPELYCGFRRRPGRGPTLYPAACSPQAWAASAPFALLQAILGLEFDPGARQIRLVNPSLPTFAADVIVRNLAIGDARVDFAVRQAGGSAASLEVLRTRGNAQVSIVLAPSGRAQD
jgi:glycogen debranching enzyme